MLNYDADIAMLIVEDEVPVARFIKPICLWDNRVDPDEDEGFITYWRQLSRRPVNRQAESVPKQRKVPIADYNVCIRDNVGIAEISSKRTFCGRSEKVKGDCLGKSVERWKSSQIKIFILSR